VNVEYRYKALFLYPSSLQFYIFASVNRLNPVPSCYEGLAGDVVSTIITF